MQDDLLYFGLLFVSALCFGINLWGMWNRTDQLVRRIDHVDRCQERSSVIVSRRIDAVHIRLFDRMHDLEEQLDSATGRLDRLTQPHPPPEATEIFNPFSDLSLPKTEN